MDAQDCGLLLQKDIKHPLVAREHIACRIH